MFDKILIANRGEIACRIIKTARTMGIATVAVYSDADAGALHVQMSDEAMHLGPPAAGQSYLLIDKIVDACRQTGAEAVHPGYGFLSENAKFAEDLKAAGVAFIGPPVGAIEVMGDKITSKKLADDAGVSTVPGHMGLIADADEAVKIAGQVGYPVMIKASAGGGGKGMRIAWNDEEAREGFERSKSEAASSFGDDRIFIEKFVTEPRHIEIQVLGDTHGNIIYLGERECSIQRRNQKVIEEAPSPFLDEKTRAAMGKEAVALSKAVDYHSAGTVEFIVDKDRNFYFLEMNTRLQVEHPVTEEITGLDLVEQMIRVAAGEKLSLSQKDVVFNGWAIESRIYAEDPYRNFLPATGRLVRYAPPAEGARDGITVRNDTGVFEGGEVSMFYDPMIAKLVTHGPSRETAIDAMSDALDRFYIDGCGHNIDFLAAVIGHERFRAGRLTTNFIAEEYSEGFQGASLSGEESRMLAALAAFAQSSRDARNCQIDGATPDIQDRNWVVTFGEPGKYDARFKVHARGGDDEMTLTVSDDATTEEIAITSTWAPGQPVFQGMVNGKPTAAQLSPLDDGWRLTHRGAPVQVAVRSPRAAALADKMLSKEPPDTSRLLLCPMPGLVVSINVAEGDTVEEGQPLAIVEAMKMENVLRAERSGTISRINATAGDTLAADDTILEFG